MDDKRNMILAVLLAGLILLGWPYVAEQFFPQPEPAPQIVATDTATTDGLSTVDTADSAAPPSASAAPDASVAATPQTTKTVSLASALKSPARVFIETPKLKGSINLVGAKIDDLLLLAHRTKLAKDSPPVRLFAPSGTKEAYYARFGWTGTDVALPDGKTVWTASGKKLTPTTPVTLSWTNETGQKFDIALSIDENYLITAKQGFTNAGAAAAQIAPFGLISRTGEPDDLGLWNIHVGPMGVFDEVANYDYDYEDITEAPNGQASFKTTGGWIGFTDKYWLAALIPDQKTPVNARMRAAGKTYQTQIGSATKTSVAPGQSFTKTSRLFAGAKEVEVLDDYVDDLGVPMLDYAISWGWFRVIEKLFFKVLNFFFGLFGNFGLAIIGLTAVVRLLMFPIAQKQFSSMAAMRVVQPKMKELQERYKEDKPKLQQEMMKLYKEEKVNPLAGCLPIVLQIPIFFALYKLLMLTIEMRHQPFVLWLKDLSAPDPSAHIVFGWLGTGITLPSFLAIGLLPILLGLTMWLMQRLNPQPMDAVQKQVFALMPWFLMFIMAPFAAGLQLYWVVSNCISILQQKWLYSRHPVLKQKMAKDAEDKAAAKAKS